jgi:hypothetical protein
MANKIYDSALYDVMNGTWGWLLSADFSVALVDNTYTFLATHSAYADISGSFLTGMTPEVMSTNTLTAGVTPMLAGSDSVTFTGVNTGQTVKAIIVYNNVGAGRLIAYYDTGVGLPLSTTGANITIDWNATAVAGTLISVTGP